MKAIARCLFCKQSTKSSKSVEHIIPESFGSKIKVLPKGIVCDQCNNYFSRKVEKPVLSHQSMRNIRAFYQVPNKKGNMPSLLGTLGDSNIKLNLKLNKSGKIEVNPENEKDRNKLNQLFYDRLNEGTFKPLIFPVEINPPKKEMSRFLAKMALEALAYRYFANPDWINSLIDESHYDLIRNFARIGTNVEYWPYYQRRIFPTDTQMIHPDTGKWVQVGFGHDILITSRRETYFVFVLYGEEFAINVGGPSIKGYEEWLEQNNNISPIIERLGIELSIKNINGKDEYFLEGIFDVKNGIMFDQKKNRTGQ